MPSIFLPKDAVRGYRKSVTVHDSQIIQLKSQSFSFCQVAAKFMVEDDEEQMKEELKEAFRIYDKEVPKTLILGETKNHKEWFLVRGGGWAIWNFLQ